MMKEKLRLELVVLGTLLAVIGLSMIVLAAPVAVDDAATTAEDTPVTIDVLTNDTGVGNVTLTIFSPPKDGTATVSSGTSITYTPDSNFNGTDAFLYQVEDNSTHETSTARVTVTVTPVDDAPVPADDYFTTPKDTPVTVVLHATDVDIDPFYPNDHPLVFAIVTAPRHGKLTGDLADVIYETPHKAYVSLTYTPDPGYAGADYVNFSVTDPFGESSTAQVQIDVGPPAEQGVLTGRWNGSMSFDGQSFSFTSFTTSVDVVYLLSSFRAEGIATWSDDTFSSLRFNVSFALGDVTVRSSLSFNPLGPEFFNYWSTVTRLDILGTSFTHTFYLADTQTSSYNQLLASWNINGVSVTSTTKFSGCAFCFDSQVFRARWNWATCDVDLGARLSFTSEGFDEFTFTIYDFPILPSDVVGIGLYMRMNTTFTTTGKEIDASLDFKSDWIDCFRILGEIVGEGMSVDGISLYGIQFQTSFPNGVGFRSDTALTEDRNASLTGYSDYFERVRIWGPTASCCGAPGGWEIQTYFQSSHTTLFDWGMTKIRADEVITDSIRFFVELTFRSDDPIWEWSSGWDVRW